MVLLAALLAPAVLALGLLVAELTQFGVPPYLRAKPAEPPVFMAPTPLPRPLTPDRLYEGRVPARKPPEREKHDKHGNHPDMPEPPVQVATPTEAKVPRGETPRSGARRTPPAEVRAACPDEWTDTWLWEVCQEEARKPA